jgi:hypothetical protein
MPSSEVQKYSHYFLLLKDGVYEVCAAVLASFEGPDLMYPQSKSIRTLVGLVTRMESYL